MKKFFMSMCLVSAVAPAWAQDRVKDSNVRSEQNAADSTSKQMLMPTSKLIGAKLTDIDGQECGSVNAFVFDSTGSVHYVIVGKGGLLGIGEDEIAVPWSAFSCICEMRDGKMSCNPKISLNGKQLMTAAKLRAKRYEELGDKEWSTKNAAMFNANLPTKPLAAGEMYLSSDIINSTVKAAGGSSSVVLDELMIQNGSGKIPFFVMGMGGLAGVGKTYIAVPFTDVKLSKVNGKIHAETSRSKEQLENATKVTPSEYPELSLSSVRDRVKTDR